MTENPGWHRYKLYIVRSQLNYAKCGAPGKKGIIQRGFMSFCVHLAVVNSCTHLHGYFPHLENKNTHTQNSHKVHYKTSHSSSIFSWVRSPCSLINHFFSIPSGVSSNNSEVSNLGHPALMLEIGTKATGEIPTKKSTAASILYGNTVYIYIYNYGLLVIWYIYS